jgi:tetratricopeptide (TPR) repeat protein
MSVTRRAVAASLLIVLATGAAVAQPEPAPDPLADAGEAPTTAPDAATTAPDASTAPAADTRADAPEEPAAPHTPPNVAVAEHLAEQSRDILRMEVVAPASWRASQALLEAATRLAPGEPRLARLLVEASLHTGDVETAADALADYRQLNPADEQAQVRQIDLYLSQMQTADEQVAYLRDVVAAEGVPQAVRARAAVRAARLLFGRFERTEAGEMLDRALKLNPLDLDALRLRFERVEADAPPAERVGALLAMVRANPAQPDVVARVGRELADAGLARDALDWYGRALQVYRQMGVAPGSEFAIDYASTLLLNDDAKSADGLAGLAGLMFPDLSEAWFVRLLAAGAGNGDPATVEKLRQETAVALSNRLATIRKAAGDAGATTRPVTSPEPVAWPDPAADLELLATANRQDLVDAYGDAAADVAWFLTYYADQPDAAGPWVAALKTLYGEESPLAARIEGWAFLKSNRPDEARVKLSAVADRDPLAAMGLVRLSEDPEHAAAEARRLLTAHPSGFVGATLAEGLRATGARRDPVPHEAEVAAAVAEFPREWLRVLDDPSQFYTLRAEPVRIAHAYAEPMLLNVQVTNTGQQPITMGDGGVIRPDLWVDALLRGVAQGAIPASAFDRLGGPLVLEPGQTTGQVVRADGGQLAELLSRNPSAAAHLQFQVMTNPSSDGQGSAAPGPAGYAVRTTNILERSGAALGSPAVERRMNETLNTGQPEQKVRVLDLLGAFVRLLSQEGAEANAREMAGAYREVIRLTVGDADPNVGAWAAYQLAMVSPADDRAAAVAKLAGNDYWGARAVAVVLSRAAGGAGADAVGKLAESDPDPVVRDLAAAFLELPAQPTTRPATQTPGTTSAGQ